MKVVYGAMSTMPSVLVTMIAGVRARDHRLVEAARSLGASRIQRLFKVVMPDVAPTVFTSAAYGLKHALLGILIVELFSSQLGIGYLITLYTSGSQPGMVYAILLTVAVLATVLGLLLSALERRVGRWRTIRTEV
jgi:NitT/TauT family transport system permease protein